MDPLASVQKFFLSFNEPMQVDVMEVRIGTTLAAGALAIFALRRSIQHKRQRQFDLTAAYLASFLALITYVGCSAIQTWDRLGVNAATLREIVYLVYHLLTMLAWMLWFMMGTKRGINDDRPEGR